MPAIALLEAVYEGTRMPPWNESIEAMLMILPPPWAMKWRPAACDRKKADLMLTFITSSQSCSLKSTASARRIRPALLTRMSSLPSCDTVSSTSRPTGSIETRLASRLRKRRPSARTFSPVSAASVMPAAAMSAPAAASARAMPWPRPVLAPVTSATLPSRLKGLPATCVASCVALLELADVQHVHVGVVEVLAAHRPDEGVVGGARAHVDRPRRRDHGLVVGHHDVALRVGLAHEVVDAVVLAQVEVEVDLAAAVVQVRRHGVPDAARLEHGQAQQQLRGLAGLGHDELVDRALVAGFQRSAVERHRVLDRQLLRLEARVRRRRGEVELGRVGGIVRGEGHVLAAHGHVQPVLRPQRVLGAVDGDLAGAAADVDHAQLAALEEGMALGRLRIGRASCTDRVSSTEGD